MGLRKFTKREIIIKKGGIKESCGNMKRKKVKVYGVDKELIVGSVGLFVKVKRYTCHCAELIQHHALKTYEGVEVQLHAFLIYALYEGE
jgi:hypothetical protein